MPRAVGDTGFTFAAALLGLLRASSVGVPTSTLKRELELQHLKPGSFDTKVRRALELLAEQGIETEWSPAGRGRERILRVVEQPSGPQAREIQLSAESTNTRRVLSRHLARLAHIDTASDVLLYLKGGMRRERIRFRYTGAAEPIEGHAYSVVPGPHQRDMVVVITEHGAYGYDPNAIYALQVIERHRLETHPDLSKAEFIAPAVTSATGPMIATRRGRPTKDRERALALATSRRLRNNHYAGQTTVSLRSLANDIGASTASEDSLLRVIATANDLLSGDGITATVDGDEIALHATAPSRQVVLDSGDALLARTELRAMRALGTQVRADFGIPLDDEQLDTYQDELDNFLNFVTMVDPVFSAAPSVFVAISDNLSVEVTHDGARCRLRPTRARLAAGEWRIIGVVDNQEVDWALADLSHATLEE